MRGDVRPLLSGEAWASLPPVAAVVSLWGARETEALLASLARVRGPASMAPRGLVMVTWPKDDPRESVVHVDAPGLMTTEVITLPRMAREADAAAIMSALDMCLQPHSDAEADTWRLRTTALRYAIFVLTTAWLLATVETPAPPQPFSADRDTRQTQEMLARARTCQFEEEVALARGRATGGGGGRRFRVRERLRRMLYYSPIGRVRRGDPHRRAKSSLTGASPFSHFATLAPAKRAANSS